MGVESQARSKVKYTEITFSLYSSYRKGVYEEVY